MNSPMKHDAKRERIRARSSKKIKPSHTTVNLKVNEPNDTESYSDERFTKSQIGKDGSIQLNIPKWKKERL